MRITSVRRDRVRADATVQVTITAVIVRKSDWERLNSSSLQARLGLPQVDNE